MATETPVYKSHQMAKIANGSKTGGSKVLAFEGFFTTAGGKNPAEPSNLCRIVLKANDTTGETPVNLTANIPVTEIPAILEASRLALNDFQSGKKALKFAILEGQAKPKESDKTEEGTLVYNCEINYDSSRTYPVTITVKNFRAEVEHLPGGRMRYSKPSKNQPTISFVVSIREFYNKIAHLDNMYKAWCAKAAIDGDFEGVI